MGTLFVTGTDTEVGKTLVSTSLLWALRENGLHCLGLKPVAAGCERTVNGLRNADALALQGAGSEPLAYEAINPYALEPAIAPHIAARQAGVALRRDTIMEAHARLAGQTDWVVVEGAGGWQVPLDAGETLADLAGQAGWPVILVVGMRLGCINHALLSVESIRRRTRLAGWIANCLPPEQPRLEANLETLHWRIDAPCFGVIPALSHPEPATAGRYLEWARLPGARHQ